MRRVAVHKFGGTSVANAARIGEVVAIIASLTEAPSQPVVVVSAMAGVTDALIHGAQRAVAGDTDEPPSLLADLEARHRIAADRLLSDDERERFESRLHEWLEGLRRLYDSLAVLGELTPRGRDAVTGHGERISAVLLAAALRTQGIPADAMDATKLIVTDDRFGDASPRMDLTSGRIRRRVVPRVETGTIPVITGYVAATEEGVPTTLGRSGSDRTAAIVAAGLSAEEVWIWTDVHGILTADPNLVAGARTLAELSYDEAVNLARFGAEVLHPRTIRPIIARRIPLRIVNSFDPEHPGTRVVAEPRSDRDVPPAIISAVDMRLLVVGDGEQGDRLLSASKVLARLAAGGVDVRMLSLALSDSSLGLVIREQEAEHVRSILSRSTASPDGADVLQSEEAVAIVSVVGSAGGGEPGVASRAFGALGRHAVRIIAVIQTTDGDGVSFCIPACRVADTVQFLHRALGLDEAIPSGRDSGRPIKQGASA